LPIVFVAAVCDRPVFAELPSSALTECRYNGQPFVGIGGHLQKLAGVEYYHVD
jgi:hypothetical protein